MTTPLPMKTPLPTHVPLAYCPSGGLRGPPQRILTLSWLWDLAWPPGPQVMSGHSGHSAGMQLTQAVPVKVPPERDFLSPRGPGRLPQSSPANGLFQVGRRAVYPQQGSPNLGLCLPTRELLSHSLALSLANDPGLAGRKEADPGLRPHRGDVSESGDMLCSAH